MPPGQGTESVSGPRTRPSRRCGGRRSTTSYSLVGRASDCYRAYTIHLPYVDDLPTVCKRPAPCLHWLNHRAKRPVVLLGLPLLLGVTACERGAPGSGVADDVLPNDDTPSAATHVFTYTEVRTRDDWTPALQAFRDQALPALAEQGGHLVGVWHAVPLEDDAPFERLGPTELLVMVAWPDDIPESPTGLTDRALNALEEVVQSRTRVFRSTVRPQRVRELKRPGFYVHRLNRVSPDDVNTVIRLSVEAWQTFEPTFGAEVVGLFRESPDRDGQAQMLRIAWYPSYEGWQESRMFGRDPSSQRRFRERGALEIDSEGFAGSLAVNSPS